MGQDGVAIDLSTHSPMPVTEDLMPQVLQALNIIILHLAIITDNHIQADQVEV